MERFYQDTAPMDTFFRVKRKRKCFAIKKISHDMEKITWQSQHQMARNHQGGPATSGDQYVEQRRLGPRQQLLVKSGKAEKGATKSDDLDDTGSLQCKRFKLQKTYLNNIHSRASRSKLCMSGVFNYIYKLLKQEP